MDSYRLLTNFYGELEMLVLQSETYTSGFFTIYSHTHTHTMNEPYRYMFFRTVFRKITTTAKRYNIINNKLVRQVLRITFETG